MKHHKHMLSGPIETTIVEMREYLACHPEGAECIGDLMELFEVSPNPFIRCDESGRIIYANRASGLKGSGRVKAEALPESLLEPFFRAIETKSGQACEAEHDFQKYLFVIVPFQNGKYANIHGKTLDKDLRTEIERLKSAIAESEKQNRRLAEQLRHTHPATAFTDQGSGNNAGIPLLHHSLQLMQDLAENAINTLSHFAVRRQKALNTNQFLMRGKS